MPNFLIWWAALQQEEGDCIWKCCSFSSFFKFLNIKPIIHTLAAVPPNVSALQSSSFWSRPGTATAAAPLPGQATASCEADVCRAMTVLEADVFMGDQRNSWGVRRGWHEGWTAILLESLSGRWSTYTVIFGLCQASIFSLQSVSGSKKCLHITPAAFSWVLGLGFCVNGICKNYERSQRAPVGGQWLQKPCKGVSLFTGDYSSIKQEFIDWFKVPNC